MSQKNMRIQLKRDIEANWIANPITPLSGELIIYLPDRNYTYPRVKIGDGTRTTSQLPFIDAGTINGQAVEIVRGSNYTAFPVNGSEDKLYLDMENNRLYYYGEDAKYHQLSNFNLSVSKTSTSKITSWNAGSATTITILNNAISFTNGTRPTLDYDEINVVRDVSKGV